MANPDLTPNEKKILQLCQVVHNLEEIICNLEIELSIKDRRIHELSEKLVLQKLEEKIHGKRR